MNNDREIDREIERNNWSGIPSRIQILLKALARNA